MAAEGAFDAFTAWAYERGVAPALVDLAEAATAAIVRDLPRGSSLLDVGCGGGLLAERIASRRADVRVSGLDLSPAQVARASARLGGRARFVVGSALDLPFADASFDAVISIASLKMWPDRARGLAEIARVVRPAGALAIVELHRDARPADAAAFVARWNLPASARALFQGIFPRTVLRRSVSLAEARALVEALPLVEKDVQPIAGTPFFAITGKR